MSDPDLIQILEEALQYVIPSKLRKKIKASLAKYSKDLT